MAYHWQVLVFLLLKQIKSKDNKNIKIIQLPLKAQSNLGLLQCMDVKINESDKLRTVTVLYKCMFVYAGTGCSNAWVHQT